MCVKYFYIFQTIIPSRFKGKYMYMKKGGEKATIALFSVVFISLYKRSVNECMAACSNILAKQNF